MDLHVHVGTKWLILPSPTIHVDQGQQINMQNIFYTGSLSMLILACTVGPRLYDYKQLSINHRSSCAKTSKRSLEDKRTLRLSGSAGTVGDNKKFPFHIRSMDVLRCYVRLINS